MNKKVVQCNAIGKLYTGNVVISLHSKFLAWKSVDSLLTLSLHQMSPLHLATESGHINIVNHLVEQGADVNIQDDDGVIICQYQF